MTPRACVPLAAVTAWLALTLACAPPGPTPADTATRAPTGPTGTGTTPSGTTPSGTTGTGATPSGTTPTGTTPSGTTGTGTTGTGTTGTGTTPSGTTTTGPPVFTAIVDLQTGAVPEATEVWVTGTVTGASVNGAFIQNPAGGPYSAVWLYIGPGGIDRFGTFLPGDVVRAYGRYVEYAGMTELDLSGPGTVLEGDATGGARPAAHTIPIADLIADPEPWESVLLRFDDVRVSSPGLPYGEFEVTSNVDGAVFRLDDLLWRADVLPQDTELEYVQGPLNFAFEVWKLEPAGPEDIVIR
ncbi:MAG: hypothetical protein ACI9K2_000641 [Myxococcota bacterium]|jgi:hypothetical protein